MSVQEIGLSPAWLFEDQSALTALLEEETGSGDVSDLVGDVLRIVGTFRQIALRKCIASGMERAFPLGAKGRDSLRKLLERVTGLSPGQVNRVLNGVGVFSDTDSEARRDTHELLARVVDGNRQMMMVIPLEIPVQLALASGEDIELFVGSPPRFAATLVSVMLRVRVAGSENETEFEAAQRTQRRYPSLAAGVSTGGLDRSPVPPIAKMACYGLYIWQASGIMFADGWSREMVPESLRRGERWAGQYFRDLLPDGGPSETDRPMQFAERISATFRACVFEVAGEVGRALCGLSPYTRQLPQKS